MVKASVIGLGKMGISHCAIINAHPDVELVSVCDTSTLVLEGFKKYSTIKTYSDYLKMLNEEKLDCVIVATPTRFHYEIVMESLSRGLHVFCEKPFSLTTEQGKKMVQLAVEKKLINQVGYHNRFLGTFRELKRLVDHNLIGDIYHFTGEAFGPVVVREKAATWRSQKEEGGGCLFDYASHVINLIQYILDTPVKVSGTQLKSVFSKVVEDFVHASLFLRNGISGHISVNWSDDTYRKMSTSITLYGKKGKIICDATELKIFLKEENKEFGLEKGWNIKYITDFVQPVNFYLRGEEYTSQIDHFINLVTEKSNEHISPFEEAYNTDVVIDLLFNDVNVKN